MLFGSGVLRARFLVLFKVKHSARVEHSILHEIRIDDYKFYGELNHKVDLLICVFIMTLRLL